MLEELRDRGDEEEGGGRRGARGDEEEGDGEVVAASGVRSTSSPLPAARDSLIATR